MPRKAHDIRVGDEFGRLTVTGPRISRGGSYYPCRCSCDGNAREYNSANLVAGRTRSCGCLNREVVVERLTKHGGRGTRLYPIWCQMRNRCTLRTSERYADYGGRGIKVCDEWQDFAAFRDWAMANGYRDDLTIERKDVNGDYCPENCTWIPMAEQARNKRTNHRLTIFGETKILADWVKDPRCAVNHKTFKSRIYQHGWDPEKALTTPLVHRGGRPRKN